MIKTNYFSLFIFILFFTANINCLKIDRVILSTDNNPLYIEFWPIVAKVWKQFIGIQPTLALIADKSVEIDETLGDVIRFEPIKGVPIAMQAQCIRLLLPAYFEDDVCITSDIDMIPLNRNYFFDPIKNISGDCFVVYKNGYYERCQHTGMLPMCYNAAKGKIFKEIFKIKNIKDVNEIESIIKYWHSLNWGWGTDERMLNKHLTEWKFFKTRCIKLGHFDDKRIDRLKWNYNGSLVKNGFYHDAHCPRPYSKYKKIIDRLVNFLEIK